jgi:DHA1 family bicyclomycin/chloramphenicol resistance-like MFS transporter
VTLLAEASFWYTTPVERLGMPAIKVSDGPNRARGDVFGAGMTAACFPAGVVIARAVVRDFYAGLDIARFFALTMLITGLVPILAPVIGGQLLLMTTWRGIFLVLAAIGAALVIGAGLGLPESLPVERRHSGGLGATLATFGRLLTDRTLIGYALASGLAFAAMFAYISGSPFVLQGIYGVSPQEFSLIFGGNALGVVAAGQVSGRLVGRVHPRRLLTLGLATALTGSLVRGATVLVGAGLVVVLAALFLVVASIGLIAPNATALALPTTRARRAVHPRCSARCNSSSARSSRPWSAWPAPPPPCRWR